MTKCYVPVAGYYQVASKVYRMSPTGKFETVPNPDRRFFQLWKPKLVEREIWETI